MITTQAQMTAFFTDKLLIKIGIFFRQNIIIHLQPIVYCKYNFYTGKQKNSFDPFIPIFGLWQWSVTECAISPRYACINNSCSQIAYLNANKSVVLF